MMDLVAAVPVKALAQAKSRLGRGVEDRPGLVLFMLERVLRAVSQARSVRRTAVVSPDSRALHLAARWGCVPIRQEDGDLNQACALAVSWAGTADGLLLVHGDLPWLERADVEAVAQAAEGHGPVVVLGTDRTGTGTNLLLLRPPGAIGFRFGPGSLSAHMDESRRHGVPTRIIQRAGVTHDLDTVADFVVEPPLRALPELARFAPLSRPRVVTMETSRSPRS